MFKECGLIFNRHNWLKYVHLNAYKYTGEVYMAIRFCSKCGTMQKYTGWGIDGDHSWDNILLTTFKQLKEQILRENEEVKLMRIKNHQLLIRDRKQALKEL